MDSASSTAFDNRSPNEAENIGTSSSLPSTSQSQYWNSDGQKTCDDYESRRFSSQRSKPQLQSFDNWNCVVGGVNWPPVDTSSRPYNVVKPRTVDQQAKNPSAIAQTKSKEKFPSENERRRINPSREEKEVCITKELPAHFKAALRRRRKRIQEGFQTEESCHHQQQRLKKQTSSRYEKRRICSSPSSSGSELSDSIDEFSCCPNSSSSEEYLNGDQISSLTRKRLSSSSSSRTGLQQQGKRNEKQSQVATSRNPNQRGKQTSDEKTLKYSFSVNLGAGLKKRIRGREDREQKKRKELKRLLDQSDDGIRKKGEKKRSFDNALFDGALLEGGKLRVTIAKRTFQRKGEGEEGSKYEDGTTTKKKLSCQEPGGGGGSRVTLKHSSDSSAAAIPSERQKDGKTQKQVRGRTLVIPIRLREEEEKEGLNNVVIVDDNDDDGRVSSQRGKDEFANKSIKARKEREGGGGRLSARVTRDKREGGSYGRNDHNEMNSIASDKTAAASGRKPNSPKENEASIIGRYDKRMRLYQDGPEIRWFRCDVTECVFYTNKPERMERHRKCHVPGRPGYSCPGVDQECSSHFKSLSKMLKHDRMCHTNVKDYECRLCGEEVTDIKMHMKVKLISVFFGLWLQQLLCAQKHVTRHSRLAFSYVMR